MKLFSSAILATAVFADPQSRFRRDYLRNPANNCSKSNKYNDFWYSKDSGNFKKCVFSSFMEQVGREQMSHALKLITDDSKTIDRLIHNQEFGFNGLIEDWKRLSGFNTVEAGHDFHQEHLECGFVAIEKKFDHQWEEYQRREGYFNGCDNMCPWFENIGSYGQGNVKENAKFVARSILDNFTSIVDDQFTKLATDNKVAGPNGIDVYRIRMCRYNPEKKFNYTWDHIKRIWIQTPHSGWENAFNDECTMADRCGQIVRNFYEKVAGFEKLLGEDSIPSLAVYHQGFRDGYETMTNKNHPLYDPRHKLGKQRVSNH